MNDIANYITPTSAFLSGIIAKSSTAPIDRVKILYQTAHNKPFTYIGGFGFTKQIVKEQGLTSLWRGNAIQMFRIGPYTTLSYTMQRWLKTHYSNGEQKISTMDGLKVGAITAGVSSIIVYPLDTIRCCVATEMTRGVSATNVVKNIVRQHGVVSFWNGCTVSTAGVVPYGAFAWGGFYASNQALHTMFAGKYDPDDENSYIRTISLFGSVIVAQTIVYPVDVIRRRIQHNTKSNVKFSHVDIIKKTISDKALFRGVTLNWFKTPFANTLSFTIFSLLDKHARNALL
jgi:hypothetical protein